LTRLNAFNAAPASKCALSDLRLWVGRLAKKVKRKLATIIIIVSAVIAVRRLALKGPLLSGLPF